MIVKINISLGNRERLRDEFRSGSEVLVAFFFFSRQLAQQSQLTVFLLLLLGHPCQFPLFSLILSLFEWPFALTHISFSFSFFSVLSNGLCCLLKAH